MSVKRYEPNVYEALGSQYECEMSEDDHGDYVLNSDYDNLLARHNALKAAVRNTLVVYDRMAPSLKNHCAARAEVDRLLEEK